MPSGHGCGCGWVVGWLVGWEGGVVFGRVVAVYKVDCDRRIC